MEDLMIKSPILAMLLNVVYIAFFFVILWIFGRMGDNINKIRKMLENELIKKDNES